MEFLRWARCQWDRLAALGLFAVGIIALFLGYLGTRNSVYPAEQLPYMISGGLVGIFCIGGAAALYLSADMRDEWRKLDRIDESLRVLVGERTTDLPAEAPVGAAEPVAVSARPARITKARAEGGSNGAATSRTRATRPTAAGPPSP